MNDWDRYGSEHNTRGSIGEMDHGSEGQSWTSGSEGLRGRARKGMEGIGHGAQEVGSRARRGFDHYFDAHPLLMGMAALALGIAVGMMIPSTRPEDRLMGEAADRMRERTKDMAGKVEDVAKASLREARETARSELEQRGMDTDSLGAKAKEAAAEAREVAEKTAREAGRAAKDEAEKNKLT